MAIEKKKELSAFLMYFIVNVTVVNICGLMLRFEEYCSESHEMPYILLKILSGVEGGFTLINLIFVIVRFTKGRGMLVCFSVVAFFENLTIFAWIIGCLVSLFDDHGGECGDVVLSVASTLMVTWLFLTFLLDHSMYQLYARKMFERENEVATELQIGNEKGEMA
jgi:hypothetical protein